MRIGQAAFNWLYWIVAPPRFDEYPRVLPLVTTAIAVVLATACTDLGGPQASGDFLPAGTPLYSIPGFEVTERLTAEWEGGWVVLVKHLVIS